MPTDGWEGVLFALLPTIVVGLIFWFIMRMIVRADRDERRAYSKIEAQERARFEKERAAASSAASADAAKPAEPHGATPRA